VTVVVGGRCVVLVELAGSVREKALVPISGGREIAQGIMAVWYIKSREI